jgi:hypothetical protein
VKRILRIEDGSNGLLPADSVRVILGLLFDLITAAGGAPTPEVQRLGR